MPIAVLDPLVVEPLTLAELANVLPGSLLVGDDRTLISGVQYDSRKIGKGDLFVALSGGYFDGHNFVEQARANGAAAILVERQLDADIPQVVVGETRAALAKVAASFYRYPSHRLEVVGITGTDGKTTTSYLVESIFDSAGWKTGIIGTVGVRVGEVVLDAETRQTTPESLDVQRHLATMVQIGARAAIIEATSHGLDLHRLDETRFVTGAVTNVTHEHLEHHKTIAAYRRAKAILFERVGENHGRVVVNIDDEGAREMIPYASGATLVTYSADGRAAGLIARNIQLKVTGSQFEVQSKKHGTHLVETPMVGLFNVANALCALGIALSHDISLKLSIHALRQTPQIPGRMEPVKQGQPFAVIVDYAHTPESIEKVLSLLSALTSGKLILVMGSAGERDRTKRPIQGEVAARLAHYSVFTTEDPRFESAEAIIQEIAAGAIEQGAVEGRDFACVTDRREAIKLALAVAEPGDCVLLAGKGHERSIIWGLEKRPWNEGLVASELLSTMGFGKDS